MSRLFFLFLLFTLLPVGTWAQNAFTMEELMWKVAGIKGARLEYDQDNQQKDLNDSTCFLRIARYTLPYKSAREQAAANEITENFRRLYGTELKTATSGMCYVHAYDKNNSYTTSQAQMFYHENYDPLYVGGRGKNYLLLRRNDSRNPIYRTVDGVEWTYQYGKTDRKLCIVFGFFKVRGRISRDAVMQSGTSTLESDMETLRKRLEETTCPESLSAYAMKDIEQWKENFQESEAGDVLLREIKMLGEMYKDKDDEGVKDAIASAISDRIQKYMKLCGTGCDKQAELFKVLADVPGCAAEVITPNGMKQLADFDMLWQIICDLPSFVHSCEPFRSAYNKTYGDKAKIFLYQIYLEKDIAVGTLVGEGGDIKKK